MDRLGRIREIMQWVRNCNEKERPVTITRIAEDLELPPASVNRLINQIYPECFIVEPYVGVFLTGKWPNDIAFDWETLKPLEKTDVVSKFRPPKDGFTPKATKPKQIDWSTAENQEGFEWLNGLLGGTASVEFLVDGACDELYAAVINVAALLEMRGPKEQVGFFHKTTGLHFTKESK